jgi:hypothetical protein
LVSARGHVGDDRFGVLWLQEGAGGLGDFCTITIDGSGGLSEDILQQRLQSVARQREELQQVEIELRAQAIAHPQIIEAQQSFQAAAKEHAAAVAKIKVVPFALSSVFLYQYPAQIRVWFTYQLEMGWLAALLVFPWFWFFWRGWTAKHLSLVEL